MPAAILAAALGVIVFVKIAVDVFEQETHSFDAALLLALRVPGNPADPLGPPWLEETMRDFTALGSVGVLSIVTLAVSGFLYCIGRRRDALFIVLTVLAGALLSSLLKFGFDRPRPDLVAHGSHVYTLSFPSGHSMMSAVVYLTLGTLLAVGQRERWVRIYTLAFALALSLLVGISRVYLGVHWPTDVLAGWALGAAWAALSAAIMLRWSAPPSH